MTWADERNEELLKAQQALYDAITANGNVHDLLDKVTGILVAVGLQESANERGIYAISVLTKAKQLGKQASSSMLELALVLDEYRRLQ